VRPSCFEGAPVAARPLPPTAAADCEAGAGLPRAAVLPILEAGHSMGDQAAEVERVPIQTEGVADYQVRREYESVRHEAVGASNQRCLPDKRGHGYPPGAPLRGVTQVTEIGPVAEIDGGRSAGSQREDMRVPLGGQHLDAEV